MKHDKTAAAAASEKRKEKDHALILKVSIRNEQTGKELFTYLQISSLDILKKYNTLIKMKGVQNICNRTKKTGQELINEGYTKIKIKIVPTTQKENK